ncbi:MAG: hypothetical protein WC391_07015 [Methanoregula sp.]|jgi:hypothetical protein
MEDSRPVIVVLILIASLALAVVPVSGYDNLFAHPMVNKYAVEYFAGQIMPVDPYLATASLNGAPAHGLDWNLSDGRKNFPSDGIVSKPKYKSPALWMTEGGFSADEPEWWQALRHFYDPTNQQTPWLTDFVFFRSAAKVLSTDMISVEIDAVSWAFDASKGNKYSYPKAKEYFKEALVSDDRNNQYYGQAWRAVGETMHLVADMTIPDHVKNDGHAIEFRVPMDLKIIDLSFDVIIDISPYERAVNGKIVEDIAPYPGLYPPAKLDYKASPRQVMINVARFTNRHFITQDSNPSYSEPDLSQPASENGYIMGTIDGQEYRVAKKVSLLTELGYESRLTNIFAYNPKLDYYVLKDQERILIPTAVRASTAVLDRFLPRFKVYGEIKTSQEMENGKPVTLYFLDGEIVFIGNKEEWPQKLTVRNGASIVNSATGMRKIIPVDKTKGDNLNEFQYQFNPSDIGAQAGDKIYLEYDLGGYVIRSADIEIPEPYPTPTLTTITPRTTLVTTTTTRSTGTCSLTCYQYFIGYGLALQPSTVNQGDPLEYADAFSSCGCCGDYAQSNLIYKNGNKHEYYDALCGGGWGTPITTARTAVPGGVDMIAYCSDTCGCWLTKERNCQNSGGGTSCNQYKTSYNSCLSSCGARLGNDGGPTKDTLQNFKSRFPPQC